MQVGPRLASGAGIRAKSENSLTSPSATRPRRRSSSCTPRPARGSAAAPPRSASEALGRQLNRRERVLDLVREPPRHVLPRRRLLRPHPRRCRLRAPGRCRRRRRPRDAAASSSRSGAARVRCGRSTRAAARRRGRAPFVDHHRERLEVGRPEHRAAQPVPRPASRPSRRDAAGLTVRIRPDVSTEITPVAMRSRMVST